MKIEQPKDFFEVLQENYQAQIAGFYNVDKTDSEREKRKAVIEEYVDLIEIWKAGKYWKLENEVKALSNMNKDLDHSKLVQASIIIEQDKEIIDYKALLDSATKKGQELIEENAELKSALQNLYSYCYKIRNEKSFANAGKIITEVEKVLTK